MSKKYNIFLDDFRDPQDCTYTGKIGFYNNTEWFIARNYDDFCKMIRDSWESDNSLPGMISFDHDLADEHYDPYKYVGSYEEIAKSFTEKTGYDCAKWLIDFCMDNNIVLPDFLVHSMNPAGGENIFKLLSNFKKFQQNEDPGSKG